MMPNISISNQRLQQFSLSTGEYRARSFRYSSSQERCRSKDNYCPHSAAWLPVELSQGWPLDWRTCRKVTPKRSNQNYILHRLCTPIPREATGPCPLENADMPLCGGNGAAGDIDRYKDDRLVVPSGERHLNRDVTCHPIPRTAGGPRPLENAARRWPFLTARRVQAVSSQGKRFCTDREHRGAQLQQP